MGKSPNAVADVSTLPCPAREGEPHEIEAGRRGPGRYSDSPVWRCQWCGVSWADLDAELRERAATRKALAQIRSGA